MEREEEEEVASWQRDEALRRGVIAMGMACSRASEEPCTRKGEPRAA